MIFLPCFLRSTLRTFNIFYIFATLNDMYARMRCMVRRLMSDINTNIFLFFNLQTIMKNIFKLFTLAALLVAGVSCENPETGKTVAKVIAGELAEVSAAGGNCSLTYTVENAVAGAVLEATVPAEATWVHDITVGESAVAFVVDANTGAARSTVMTLNYSTAEAVEVTISQAKANGISVGMLAEIAAAGGNASFTYSVVAVEGATLTATVAEETTWIHDINVTATAVEFVVDANTATAPREAVMTLAYAGESKAVTVQQAAAVAKEEAFTVTFSDPTPGSAFVTIVPKDPSKTYVFINCTSKNLSSYDGATIEDKAAAYAISRVGSWLFPFWGTPTMDYFVTGNYPTAEMTEGENEISWVLYDADEVPYLIVVGINTDAATKEEITFTTPMSLIKVPLLPKPNITIATESLNVPYSAGSNGTTFNVENPIEGVKAEATTKATWIKNISVVNDKMAFEYEENPYSAPRQATITFAYDFADYARTLTVTQEGNPNAEKYNFYITVKELHYDNVVVDVTPSNPNVKYVIGGISDYTFKSFTYNSDDMILVSKTITSISKVVKSGALTDLKIKISSVSDLYGWDAYVYAYAVDDTEKNAISELTKEKVTLVNDKPSISFTCESDGTKWTEDFFGNKALEVPATAATVTIKYEPLNLSETGLLVVEPSTSQSYTVIDESTFVVDKEAKTVTFSVTANETASTKTDYIYFKYYSDPNDTTFTDLNASLKITQPKAE